MSKERLNPAYAADAAEYQERAANLRRHRERVKNAGHDDTTLRGILDRIDADIADADHMAKHYLDMARLYAETDEPCPDAT